MKLEGRSDIGPGVGSGLHRPTDTAPSERIRDALNYPRCRSALKADRATPADPKKVVSIRLCLRFLTSVSDIACLATGKLYPAQAFIGFRLQGEK